MVGDGVDQHAVERPEQRLVVAGDRAAFGQRGAAAALDDAALGELDSSPGKRRWMSAKMVRWPVVNLSWASSARAAGRWARPTRPAAISAAASEANAK